MAEMRPNRAKRKLADGGIVTTIAGSITPDMIDALGPVEFDAVWLEGEHGPVDYGHLGDLTRACDLWGKTSLMRVALNEPGIIYRCLDNGVQGIVVPHVDTKEEAEAVVSAGKFHPIGKRGMATSRQGFGVDDFHSKVNDETMFVVLIEDIKAYNNLDEILSVDHIDVFFVAPSDFGQSMGYLDRNSPEVTEKVEESITRIVAAGRTAGSLADGDNIPRLLELGVRFFIHNINSLFSASVQSYVEKATGQSSKPWAEA